ncbi:aminotransferase [Sinorhizobium meliloti]|nr:aminotransferase [Sinorhizobium meliloti]MQX03886.1 aminotransferase [Sinorhizobium meliloti]RVH83163.1 aminotransferase [Sinorhizobium meliloti]RVK37396.1 aminotransferase [Sinorhizobium meliloti]RVM21311.1 aminotransferase [Sinorhizobium meliloti]
MLHTEPPPTATLARILHATAVDSGTYGHLLLEQSVTSLADTDISELRPYFESAHRDAREVFHAAARISLHPEDDGKGAHATYPNCLPPKTVRGLFGEVMCGIVAETYRLVGGKTWRVPIFLFREHAPVGRYIFDLVRDPGRIKEVHGRPGNDFIGLELAADGTVLAFIAGEAKWRADLTVSTLNGIMKGDGKGKGAARVWEDNGVWNDINTALLIPQGIQQICDLLKTKDRDGFARTILSLDEALLSDVGPPRTDMVLIAGNRAATRAVGTALLPTAAPPADYKAARPLQIVEIVLLDGEDIIERLYTTLWKTNG